MIDFGWLGHIAFTWQFLVAVMSIVLIDLVLAGDNAVVIAMAVRNLPGKQRLWGIALGAGAAVVVRVIATFHGGPAAEHPVHQTGRGGGDHLDRGQAAQ